MEKNNTKLNKIYKILRIILIVFVLFSAIKSCAKAYTFQDLIDFNYDINSELTGYRKTASNLLISQYNSLMTYCQNNNINLDNYNAFIVTGNYNGNGTSSTGNSLNIRCFELGESAYWNGYNSTPIKRVYKCIKINIHRRTIPKDME